MNNISKVSPERKTAILKRLMGIECALSPENLTCDGECAPAVYRKIEARLLAEQQELHAELGYEPAWSEIYEAYKGLAPGQMDDYSRLTA